MTWTMPHRVLQVVALALALVAAGAFTLGIMNAPSRGRLPGEASSDETGTTASVNAIEATPLSQERIEGPPPPPELTPEEKAKLEAEKKAKEEAEAARKAQEAAAAQPTQPATPSPVNPQPDRVGDLLDGVTPPPADPPF